MMARLLFLVPLAAFTGMLVYFSMGLQRDPSVIPTVLIDKPAPEFQLDPIEGYENGLSSEDLKGEVTLVNIFGSWCVACLIEHPLLMEIAGRGEVPIMGLNWKDPPGKGTEWLERHGDPYTRIGNDFEGRVSIDFGVTGAPETYIIDQGGRIRYKQIGPITEQVWEEDMLPVIRRLRNES